jgi:hypothetical protein
MNRNENNGRKWEEMKRNESNEQEVKINEQTCILMFFFLCCSLFCFNLLGFATVG